MYYKKETYLKIYVDVLHGIRMERYWERSNLPPILPPKAVKQAGRPKKLRIKAVSEIPANLRKIAGVYKQYTCGKCGGDGHNAKSCDNRAELLAKAKKNEIFLDLTFS